MKLIASIFTSVVLATVVALPANADITTDPYLFEAPFASPTGTFEWDTFSNPVAGPHAPDVGASGTGTGELSLTFTPQPMDGPTTPLVTTTDNIYSGGTLVDYTVSLDGLDATQANTTVVVQVAAIGAFFDFELDGNAPTESVDRGIAEDVEHGNIGSPFDTQYYWFEWQLDGGAATEYDLTFGNIATHQSLTAVRVDYLNSATVFDAVAPAAVPEPASLALLGLMSGGALLVRRRK